MLFSALRNTLFFCIPVLCCLCFVWTLSPFWSCCAFLNSAAVRSHSRMHIGNIVENEATRAYIDCWLLRLKNLSNFTYYTRAAYILYQLISLTSICSPYEDIECYCVESGLYDNEGKNQNQRNYWKDCQKT